MQELVVRFLEISIEISYLSVWYIFLKILILKLELIYIVMLL